MSKLKLFVILLLIPIFSLISTKKTFAFVDNEPGDKYYVAIKYMEEKGLIDGYEDNTFRSGTKINRAEALKILIKAANTEKISEVENFTFAEAPFSDTPIEDWYTKYAAYAKTNGIISGYPDQSFKPGNTITLVEALKIYLESFDSVIYPALENANFADANSDSWYSPYLAYASDRQMLDITSSNEVFPEKELTRGLLAELIYRHHKFGEGYKFGRATFYGAAVQGNYTASGEIFDMNQATAAHRTLPFGTMVEATNLSNGKSVVVKITDRGPFGFGRELDLSSSSFSQIASLGTGVIRVQYRIISTPGKTL